MNSFFAAWDGMFTVKQWEAIRQMSLLAEKKGIKLHEELQQKLADKKGKPDKGFEKKPVRKCPKCGGILKIFSLNKKEIAEHPGMKSKWECCKTCRGSGCGYEEYSTKEIETIIAEVKNGSPK